MSGDPRTTGRRGSDRRPERRARSGAILGKRLTIVGTSLRTRPLEERIAAARAFDRGVVPLLADGRARPILDRILAFEEAAEAHRRMESNANFGKIVLAWA